jgi:hypothetical protein
VLVDTGAVPVPLAGAPGTGALPEEVEEFALELLLDALVDGAVELAVEPFSALWIAAVSWVLTRFKAVWLAMLAIPWAWAVMALPMIVISALFRASDWLSVCARFQ